MKKFVLTVSALALFASPAFAQTGAPGLFADNQGLACNITVPVGSPLTVYVVHKSPSGATGSVWRLSAPTGPTFFYNGGSVGNANILSIGDPVSGISLAYGGCINGDFLIYSLNFFATAPVAPCTYMRLVEDPTQPAPISVDCNFAEVPVVAGQGILNATVACDCDVATESTTWGKVKSLYR